MSEVNGKPKSDSVAADANIRFMKASDVKAVQSLAEECRLGYWSEAGYRDELEQNRCAAFVAEKNELIIGFIVMRLITFKDVVDSTPILNQNIDSLESLDALKSLENNSEINGVDLQDEIHLRVKTEAEICNIAVENGFRGAGIGGKLLNAALAAVTDNYKVASTVVWLEVRESNDEAIGFYRTHGFSESYRRKKFYADPAEDALIMKLEI